IINPDQFLGGTLEMMAALKKNEVVSVMGDRLFGNPTFSLDLSFMGKPARFPVTAFKLAEAAQKPLVIVTTRKTGPRDYAIRVQEIMDIPKLKGRGMEKFRPFAQTYVGILNDYVRESPHQFFNFFDIWEQSDA
ncbi:MAG: lipid A biosynthesis acyltransferase, partial [Desulfovibrionales bacterium]|nr:lipid A biosynthesis acyltransferase [Desulfovibrionales bacterium]